MWPLLERVVPLNRCSVLMADATLSMGRIRYFEPTGIGVLVVIVASTVSPRVSVALSMFNYSPSGAPFNCSS